MKDLESIKRKIKTLYETDPNVHVDVSINHPKLIIKNEHAVIKEIYRNLFRLEEYSTGIPKCYTLQYTDVLTGQIRIRELEEPEADH